MSTETKPMGASGTEEYSSDDDDKLNPILHVVVVGFHHKKGCQVEYAYPPLIPGNPVDSHELPDEWRHLPSLALPDGAHNYTKDTIYFHLPSRDGEYNTIYGVSCYQQMDSKDLLSRAADVTRNTVQKSVCVLSKLPLYGLIQTKLELITHAYFDERDFSKVELLIDTYQNLTTLLTESQLDGTKIYYGLPARDLVVLFRHKILILFKLLLLERRVLFTGKPVQELCQTMLGIMSLFPGLIAYGLKESACYSPHRQLSPTLKYHRMESDIDGFLEVSYHKDTDCDISMSHPRPPSRTISLASEPENQTILRDENDIDMSLDHCPDTSSDTFPLPSETLTTNANPKTTKENLNLQKKLELQTSTDNMVGKPVNGMKLNSLEKDVINNNQSCEIIVPLDCESLVNVDQITLIEVVQKPESSFVEDQILNDTQNTRSSKKNIDLSVTETSEDLKRSDSIEELDSPESISKIDREDCFSWEEDRIFLEINHDRDLKSESERSPCFTLSSSIDSASLGVNSATNMINTLATSTSNITAITTNTTTKTASVNCDTSMKTSGYESLASDATSATSNKLPSKTEDEVSIFSESINNVNNSTLKSPTCSPTNSSEDLDNISIQSAGSVRSRLTAAVKNKPNTLEVDTDAVTMSTTLQQDEYGLPLAIFSKGCLCHPYLSLQFYDLLEDVNVRGFVIGATNILFKQRKHLTDVVVEVNDGRIDFHDNELKKQLSLTTTDLRFADFLVKIVTEGKSLFLDGTEWEGGDEWVRVQFKEYILSLLASTQGGDERMQEDFNPTFIQAWKTTHNYRLWQSCSHPSIESVSQSHPFQGHLNMNDLRVRLSHTMQSTEKGKKINAAVSQTGKYVVQTGKVVGGALTSAKSAMSSWFTSLTTDWKQNEKDGSIQPATTPE